MTAPGPTRIAVGDMRDHNRGLLLTLLDRAGAMSRAELADATGLVRGAVTGLMAGLFEDRLVRVADHQPPSPAGRGRRKEQLELDGTGWAVVAVEVLLGEYRTLVTDLGGRDLHQAWTQAPTPIGDVGGLARGVAARLTEAAAEARARGARIAAVRVVMPAPVHRGGRAVVGSTDFAWLGGDARSSGFVEGIAELSPIEVEPLLVNDANAAAYAEYSHLRREPGLASLTDLIYLKSDVGFGGGAVVRGEILESEAGFAFEPGHVHVDGAREVCDCGQVGCLATVAGSQVVLERAGLTGTAERLGHRAAFDVLHQRCAEGDARAKEALADALGAVREVLTAAIMLLGPQVVVLGGYLGRYREEIARLHDGPLLALGLGEVRGRDAVRAGSHGDLASLRGAVEVARGRLLAEPSGLQAVG